MKVYVVVVALQFVVFRAVPFPRPLSNLVSGVRGYVLAHASIRLGYVSALFFCSSVEEVVFKRSLFPWSWYNSTVVLIMANLQVLGRFLRLQFQRLGAQAHICFNRGKSQG